MKYYAKGRKREKREKVNLTKIILHCSSVGAQLYWFLEKFANFFRRAILVTVTASLISKTGFILSVAIK